MRRGYSLRAVLGGAVAYEELEVTDLEMDDLAFRVSLDRELWIRRIAS
jgi:hypothetical protein